MFILWILVLFKKRTALCVIISLLIFYMVVYYISIYAVFLFSMPLEEALVLPRFERYAMSMGIYILLLSGMFYGDLLFNEPQVSLRTYRSFKTSKSKFIYQGSL